jgi:hypothetical protein
LSWLEAAVAVLTASRRPLRAREIVDAAQELGLSPMSLTKTPIQSVNRDLHAAIRRNDARIVAGPVPGQFYAPNVAVAEPGTAQAPSAQTVRSRQVQVRSTARLPIGPLASLIQARGGLIACGVTAQPGDSEEHARWAARLQRGFLRARTGGSIGLYDADELAVRALGLHPSSVWGETWWEAVGEVVVAPSLSEVENSELAHAV